MAAFLEGEGAEVLRRPGPEQSDLPDDSGEWAPQGDLPDDSGEWAPQGDLPDDSGEWAPQGDLPDDSDEQTTEAQEREVEKVMEPPVVLEFNCPPGVDPEEFKRQLDNQQEGLNKQTLAENIENRQKYAANGRDVGDGKKAQDQARQEAVQERIAENRKKGMDFASAKAEAEEWIKTQAALHDPDQIAGGDPLNVTGVGDANVNKSIGAQWRGKVQILNDMIQDYIKKNNLSEADCKMIQLNVVLEVKR